MILRIKTSDFSPFVGYEYANSDNALEKYIKLFNENKDIHFLQIESEATDLTIQKIAYISDCIENSTMFVKTDWYGGENKKYVLCFAKKE